MKCAAEEPPIPAPTMQTETASDWGEERVRGVREMERKMKKRRAMSRGPVAIADRSR